MITSGDVMHFSYRMLNGEFQKSFAPHTTHDYHNTSSYSTVQLSSNPPSINQSVNMPRAIAPPPSGEFNIRLIKPFSGSSCLHFIPLNSV